MANAWETIKNSRQYIKIASVSQSLDKHLFKNCAYCDLKMGLGFEFPVTDFIQHLKEVHPDKIEPGELKKYDKILRSFS